MRILSAMDDRTLEEEVVPVLTGYADAMRRGGYGPLIRQDIISGALKRDRDLRATGNRHRTRQEILAAKEASELKYINTWFLRGSTTAVIKVQATPGSILALKVKEKLKGITAPDGGTTLTVEATGKSILAGLRAPDPLRKPGCPHSDQCLINPEQSCGATRVIYKVACSLCPAYYLGTTGHSCHKRSLEHQEAIRTSNTKNAMAKHFATKHPEWQPGDQAPFMFHMVKGPNIQGNLQRYLGEAIQIREHARNGADLLNSKGEWGRINLKRLAVVED